jgi:hypothetical protein
VQKNSDDLMSLTQFGSIFKFAIQIESRLAEFYEQAAEDNVNADEFTKRAKACRTRKRRLEESRRLNVTEMILEPIEGLNEADYSLNLTSTKSKSINAIEETVSRFYADAAPKINVLESRRIFKRCQKEHARYLLAENK